MFYDMTREEKENFKDKLYEQLNYGQLKRLEKSLKALNYFFWGLVTLFFVLLTVSLIWFNSFGTFTIFCCIPLLIIILISIKSYFSTNRSFKKELNDFIMNLSNDKMTYKEYKMFKNIL